MEAGKIQGGKMEDKDIEDKTGGGRGMRQGRREGGRYVGREDLRWEVEERTWYAGNEHTKHRRCCDKGALSNWYCGRGVSYATSPSPPHHRSQCLYDCFIASKPRLLLPIRSGNVSYLFTANYSTGLSPDHKNLLPLCFVYLLSALFS